MLLFPYCISLEPIEEKVDITRGVIMTRWDISRTILWVKFIIFLAKSL